MRNAPGDRQSLFLRFVKNGKVGIARETVVDLNEICAALFEAGDAAPRVRRSGDGPTGNCFMTFSLLKEDG